ncbi:putative serine carboxypeptidase (CBP1), putative,serine peptidase, Clan SC, Family S10 [Trypanosoma grayi]|uniref:putative serine carboxypeptidase (CBP1), putative,serine peptidase, Clan SC, Family S10 n=1 Tax=Trypanosoma grayi TaxID=71804 RepID=UPI0004F48275|nr:putative serine carboxypeptidase (CBP1), putative,serine peptidase, Clan SC, Family S10 [Trypanosoma grayi]KEG15519.1 putative serine carboxypeptidase (CBP1), putative,serine peptidase, Clan SC, Family S10 [Trypanosoma grayi]
MTMTRFRFSAIFALIAAAALAATTADALYASMPPRLRETSSGWRPCDPNVPQWSGYFDIPGSAGDKHYFYWAFGPRNKNPNAPVLLWMTGGPGCSSMLALLVENGPCLMNETTGEIYNNTYSWNNEAYVIYIDQPAGVGFSYANASDADKNEEEVSNDMYNFVQAFFGAHKELRNNDFFVVGESYGGHYAPATAYRISQGNRNNEGPHIRLTGLAVGNGLTDPYTQYASYPPMAWDWCKEKLGEPCVNEAGYKLMQGMVPACQKFIEVCDSGDGVIADAACMIGRVTCNPIIGIYSATGLNNYDIRKKCVGTLCYNFDGVDKFMNRGDVQKALGADPQPWESCNMSVNLMFAIDWLKNFNYTIPALLEDGVRVMIYAGDMDFICNWIGNKNWTLAMQWPGQDAFNAAADVPFATPDGTVAGLIRSVATDTSPLHFSFVQVYNAGHMVPMDQPAAASAIINNFMQNKPLS